MLTPAQQISEAREKARKEREERADYLRRYLGMADRRGRCGISDGTQSYSTKTHWNRAPEDFKPPIRSAEVTIQHHKLLHGSRMMSGCAEDEVTLSIQEYEYLIDVLRDRISLMETHAAANQSLNILEERKFAVDLICKLDV